MKVTYECHQAPQMWGSFGDTLRQKRGFFSDKAYKNSGSFSEVHQKNTGFQGQKFLNILSNLSKFVKNQIFCWKLSLVWLSNAKIKGLCAWDVCRDFRLLMSLLATVAGEILTANLLQKLIFRSGILCYHCWYWHWKSKVSPYIIW